MTERSVDSEQFTGLLPGQPLAESPRRRLVRLFWLLILATYLLTVVGKWRPTPDSAVYLGLARSLAQDGRYIFNGKVNNYVTPGLPLILAGLSQLGVPNYWLPNLFMALSAVGALALIYLVFARISDRRMAMAVTFGTAATYTFFFNAHRVLTEMPFSLLFFAAVYASLRASEGKGWWMLLVLPLVVLGITVRIAGAPVIGALAFALVIETPPAGGRRGRQLLRGVVIFVVAAAVVVGFYILAIRAASGAPAYMKRIPGQTGTTAGEQVQAILISALWVPDSLAECITSRSVPILTHAAGYLIVALAGVGAAVQWRRRERLMPALVVSYALCLALLRSRRWDMPRYLLPVIPGAIYLSLAGLCWCVRRWRDRHGLSMGPGALTKAILGHTLVILICNGPYLAVHTFYYTWASYTDRYYDIIARGHYADFFTVGNILRDQCPEDRFAYSIGSARLPHYLSGRRIVIFGTKVFSGKKDAASVLQAIRSRDDLGFVLIETRRTDPEFLKEVTAGLAEMLYQPVFAGKTLLVYKAGDLGDR